MKDSITSVVDIAYPLFRRFMPLQTYRYAFCGGANAAFGLFTYFIGYRFLFAGRIFDMGFFAFKPHIAALFLSSTITFFIGFLLNRYVVFTSSYLRGRIQLFRYFLSFAFNLVFNYLMLKLLVEIFHMDAVLSQVITIILVIGISYLTQKHFTFRVKNDGNAEFSDLE
ncbi:MAG: GtrA family protein [Chitinophagaceae bacterium]|nr:MAG: GtrA family protein [Chitinophagaceae bacterium]